VELQVTVTGFAGSPVEPGVALPGHVAASVGRILEAGIATSDSVTLRLDPLARIRHPSGLAWSNRDPRLQDRILDLFRPLGIVRVTSSRLDAHGYPAVGDALAAQCLAVDPHPDDEAVADMRRLDASCRARGMGFSICVDPDVPDLVERGGCIDGRRINARRAAGVPAVWDVLHNDVGTQRRRCRCTWSLDIAASPGVGLCSSAGFGCLYCYAQAARPARRLIEASRGALARALRGDDPSWARIDLVGEQGVEPGPGTD